MDPDPLRTRLQGAMTALVTPFRDGEIDHRALEALIDWQITEGIDALVPCGTTGEAPTLSAAERGAVIRRCVEVAAGRVPVVAGTGTNSTEATIANTRAAQTLGADAALIVTPYYNRPSQEGMFRHFEAVANAVDIPIILYNVRSRTGVDLDARTIERLAGLPNIIGIKDATGDLSRPMALSSFVGDRFVQLSGHDATALGFNMMGGRGTISVVANVMPRLCAQMHDACRRGDAQTARAIQQRLQPLIFALERETNPVPAKHALHLLRAMPAEVRLPLVPVMPATAQAIAIALCGLLDDDAHAHAWPAPRLAAGRG